MRPTVQSQCKFCMVCQAVKEGECCNSYGQMAIQNQKAVRPNSILSILYLDFVGPMVTNKGKRYFLTAICSATNWVHAVPVAQASSKSVIDFFEKEILPSASVPDVCVTDNGSHFVSHQLENYFMKRQIKHNRIALYHPQSNHSHNPLSRYL